MMNTFIVLSLLLFASFKSAYSIRCYICNSSDSQHPFSCGEYFDRFDRQDMEPKECSTVHDAKYCIKHTGRYGVICILCYQCSTSETISCTDAILNMPDSPLVPEPCDHLYDARYCIKATKLSGGIGARRFCSSKDLGNYCGYVKNIGDTVPLYSCIFTCSTDGCNTGSTFNIPSLVPFAFFGLAVVLRNLV